MDFCDHPSCATTASVEISLVVHEIPSARLTSTQYFACEWHVAQVFEYMASQWKDDIIEGRYRGLVIRKLD